MEYTRMIANGRITIPEELRIKFDLKLGDWLAVKEYKDKALILYKPKEEITA